MPERRSAQAGAARDVGEPQLFLDAANASIAAAVRQRGHRGFLGASLVGHLRVGDDALEVSTSALYCRLELLGVLPTGIWPSAGSRSRTRGRRAPRGGLPARPGEDRRGVPAGAKKLIQPLMSTPGRRTR